MADKFWQQSSFKDFVSSIKSGKSSGGDDNPSTTPSPFKAAATGRIGTKTGTGSGGIGGAVTAQSRKVPVGLSGIGTPLSGTGKFEVIKPGQTKITQQDVLNLSSLMTQAGTKIAGTKPDVKIPQLNPASQPMERLFFDPVKNEYTTIKSPESYALVPAYGGGFEYVQDFKEGESGRFQVILDSNFIYRMQTQLNEVLKDEPEEFTGVSRVGYLPGEDTPITGSKLAQSYHDATFGRDMLSNISTFFKRIFTPNDPTVLTSRDIDKTKFVFKDYQSVLDAQGKYSRNEMTLAEFNSVLDQNVMPVTPTTADSTLNNFMKWIAESEMLVAEVLGVDDLQRLTTGGLFKLIGNSEVMRYITGLNKIPSLLFGGLEEGVKPWSKEDFATLFSSPVGKYIDEYRRAQRGKLPSWTHLIQKFPEIKGTLDPLLGQVDEAVEILDNATSFIQSYKQENGKSPTVREILSNSYEFQFNNIERTASLSLSPLSPLNAIEQTKFGYEIGKLYLGAYQAIPEYLERRKELSTKIADSRKGSLSEVLDEKVMYEVNQGVFDAAADMQDKALINIDSGEPDKVLAGYKAFIDSYKYMDDNLPRSPFVSPSTLVDPQKQELAYSLIAQYDIQKRFDTGVPITRSEIKDILDTLADPGVELAWSLIADLKNILNLPLGKGINALPSGAIKSWFQTIPNFELKQIDGMLSGIAYHKVIRPLFKNLPTILGQIGSALMGAPLPDISDTMRMLGQTNAGKAINKAIPIWDAASLFDLSTNSRATQLAQSSETTILMLSGRGRKVLTPADISEIGTELDEIGARISTLRKDGKGSSEIADILVEEAQSGLGSGKSISLNARRRIEALVLMSETIDPESNKWSGVVDSAYKNINDALYNNKLDELIIKAQEQMSEIADPEALRQLAREFQDEAKRYASANTTNVSVASRVGAAFADSFKEKHAAWKNATIMEDTISGAIGKAFPGSRGFLSGLNKTYKMIKSTLVKRWLMMNGRLLAGQFQENETAFALSHPGGFFSGLVDGVPWNKTWLDAAEQGQFLDMSELLVHARSTYKAGLGDDLDVALTNQAFANGINPNWIKALRRNFVGAYNKWLSKTLVENNLPLPEDVKFLTDESSAKDIWAAFIGRKRTRKFVDDMIKSQIDLKPQTIEDLITKSKLLYAEMRPVRLWADTTSDSASLLETVYRAKMSYRFTQANMRKLNPITFVTQADGIRTYLRGLGMPEGSIEEIIGGWIKPAWDRAYGSGNEFLKLINIDEILDGKPVMQTWMPSSVRNSLTPENMFAAQLIQEMFAGEMESVISAGGKITDQTIDTFFTKVKDVIKAQNENALNPEGLSGASTLNKTPNGYTISAEMSKILDLFEEGKTLRGVNKVLENSQDLIDELDIDITGKKPRDIVSEIYSKIRPQKITKGMSWKQINDALHLTDIPDDVKRAIGLELREQIRNNPEIAETLISTEADEAELVRYIRETVRDDDGNMVTEKIATSIAEDILRTSDTFEYRTASDVLNTESGRFFGVLEDVRKKAKTDTKASDLFAVTSQMRREVDVIVNEMDGSLGWLWTKDPAYSLLKGKNLHEAYQTILDFKTHYRQNLATMYRNVREQMENYLAGKTSSIYVPNRGEIWSMMGFKNFSLDETGAIQSVDFINPANGIKHTYSAKTRPYLFTDFMSRSGIYTVDDLNAPVALLDVDDPSIFTTRTFMGFDGEVQMPPMKRSVFIMNTDNIPREHTMFVRAYLQSEVYGGQPLDHYVRQILAPELTTKGLIYEQLTADELIAEIDALIAKRRNMGLDKQADALQSMRYRISYPIEYIDSLANPNVIVPPPIALYQFPEELQTWIQFSTENAAAFENMLGALDAWQKSARDAVSNNSFIKSVSLPENIARDDFRLMINKSAKAMNEMYDTALYGGNVDGIEIEGSVPHMNLIMKDYATSATVFDEAMKNIYWFWMFPTRGAASWARLIVDKPMIVAYYNKYLQYGRHQAYEQGAVDSKGRPYTSLASKFSIGKIMGTNIWIDALAGSPFLRYFMRPNRAAYSRVDEEMDDQNPVAKLVNSVIQEGSLYGLRLGATGELLVRLINDVSPSGTSDPYTGYGFGESLASYGLELLPIPKELQDAMVQTIFRVMGAPKAPKLWDARVSWFDSLVEEEIYTDLLVQIENAKSDEEVRSIVSKYVFVNDKDELYGILTNPNLNREAYDLWNDAAWKVTMRNTFLKTLPGWLTSFYPRYWSDEQLQVNNLRDRLNFQREQIENRVGLKLFTPDIAATEMYQLSNDSRFGTPEGWVYNIRTATRFVKDEETGELISDPTLRRKTIAADLIRQYQTDAFYSRRAYIYERFHENMRDCALSGASSNDPCVQQAWDNLSNELLSLENDPQYQYAERPYNIGLRPTDMVIDDWRDFFFDTIRNTRPRRDREHGESYDEWEKRDIKWKASLPQVGAQMASTLFIPFMQSYGTEYLQQSFDYNEIVNQLVSESNWDGFHAWELSRDNIFQAAMTAYDEMYMEGLMRAIDSSAGSNDKKLIAQQYNAEHSVPTIDQIGNKIIEIYGDKWTPAQINAALTNPSGKPREVLPAQDSLDIGRNEYQIMWDDAWNVISWSLPGSSTKLKNEFVRLGGHPNDWDKMYNSASGGKVVPMLKWETEGGFEQIPALLKQAAMNIGITAPKGEELIMRAQAERENAQFKQMAVMQLGEGILEAVDRYGAMSSTQRRQLKKDDPAVYERIQMYYKLKDQYAAQYPTWARYYNVSSGGGAKYYGYSGRSSRRSGGRSVARSGDQFIPVGMRSTQDANTLLAPENLGKGGVAGMPKLPTQFWEKTTIDLRSEIYRFVNGDAQLSKAAVGFLTRQADRYPEYKPEIDKLLAEEEVTVT